MGGRIRAVTAALAASGAIAAAGASDRIARVLPAPPGTPIAVQITVGEVVVRGWDRDEISVEIARHAPDGLPLPAAVIDRTAEGVGVRAVQAADARDARVRTDVALRVPATTHLREVAVFEGRVEISEVRGGCSARVERGTISGRQLGGALRLETAIGDIRLEGVTVGSDGPLRLRTFNGNIALELAAAPRDARILALSMGGRIRSDLPLTLKQGWGPRFGETTIGRGDPVVSLDAVNGDISIRLRK